MIQLLRWLIVLLLAMLVGRMASKIKLPSIFRMRLSSVWFLWPTRAWTDASVHP